MYYDPDEIDEDEIEDEKGSSNRNKKLNNRKSLARLGSSLHTLFSGGSSSSSSSSSSSKSKSKRDSSDSTNSSKRSSRFFNSIRSMGRRAVSFRFSSSSSKKQQQRPGSVLKAIQEEVAMHDEQENSDVTLETSLGKLIDSNVLDEDDVDVEDMLGDIDPPPTPIVVLATSNDDETTKKHALPLMDAPQAPISPKSKILENIPEEVMLGHVYMRCLESSEMDFKTHCMKSTETLSRKMDSRHRIRISKTLLEAIDMSNSSDSVIDEGAPVTEIDLYVEVLECENIAFSLSLSLSLSLPTHTCINAYIRTLPRLT